MTAAMARRSGSGSGPGSGARLGPGSPSSPGLSLLLALLCAHLALVPAQLTPMATEVLPGSIAAPPGSSIILRAFFQETPGPEDGQTTIDVFTINSAIISGFQLSLGSQQGVFVPDIPIISVGGPANAFSGILITSNNEIIAGNSIPIAVANPPPPFILQIVVENSPTGEIFVFGNGAGNSPIFSTSQEIILINDITLKSDPHFTAINGQSEFDFTGEAGKIYAIISDVGLAVNALFAQAWATGLSMDANTFITSPMYPRGTWVSSMGIIADSHSILVSTEGSLTEEICGSSSLSSHVADLFCLKFGKVEVDGEAFVRTGRAPVDPETGMAIELKNSKSFSRIRLESTALRIFMDIVSPPASWEIDKHDITAYSHINMRIERMYLTSGAHGILGQTHGVNYNEAGQPILRALDENGRGIVMGLPRDYELQHIFATEFKYSHFGSPV